MAGAVALSPRELMVSRRPAAAEVRRSAATPDGKARALDRFEAPDPGAARAPLPGAVPVEAEGAAALADSLRAALNRGGEAVRQALEDNALSRAAGRALQGALAPLIDRLGASLDEHVHGRVLRNTSLLMGSGLRLNLPGVNVNGGVWGNLYLPSVELARRAQGASQAMYVNYGADVESPLGGLGWGRRGKASAVVNLFFVTASFDEKQQVIFLGIPGIFGVTLGKDVERGSYVTLQNAIPLTPLLFFGPLWTQALELYTPLLDPVIEHVVRPVAGAIVKGVNAVAGAVDKAWRGLKTWLRGEDALEPA